MYLQVFDLPHQYRRLDDLNDFLEFVDVLLEDSWLDLHSWANRVTSRRQHIFYPPDQYDVIQQEITLELPLLSIQIFRI